MKYVFSILLSFFLLDSFADCEPKRSVRDEFVNTDIIFVGIPISKEKIVFIDSLDLKRFKCDTCSYAQSYCSRTMYKYQFVVSEYFKGNQSGDTITIYSNTDGGMNGYNFEVGNKYIVYSYITNPCFYSQTLIFNKDIIYTSACTRTCVYNTKEYNKILSCVKKRSKN